MAGLLVMRWPFYEEDHERQESGRAGPNRGAMSKTFAQILRLVQRGDVKVSDHGYDELAADGLSVRDAMAAVRSGTVVEDYPDYPKGPCVLVLQKDQIGEHIHVVWGIPRGSSSPAVLITAYRPDPARWESDLLRRKK